MGGRMKVPFITKKTSLDNLRSAVIAGEDDMRAAEVAVETTAAARAAALLDDDEAVALSADDEARRAVLRRDRAVARLEAARQSLAEAEEAEATAKRAAHRKALDAKNAAIRDRLTELLAQAEGFRALFADIEDQRVEIRKFNASLPADEEKVADPEAFRTVPGEPEELVSETIAVEWCEPGAVSPVNALALKEVTANSDGKTGWLRHWGGSTQVVRRRVRRRVMRERMPPTTFYPLASVLSIPGLLATDRPAWRPTEPEFVKTAVEALTRPVKAHERATREIVEILED